MVHRHIAIFLTRVMIMMFSDCVSFLLLCVKVACKKYEAAIQMLQDMNDRYSYTLAMIGLVKTLLALNTQKQMVSKKQKAINSFYIRLLCLFVMS